MRTISSVMMRMVRGRPGRRRSLKSNLRAMSCRCHRSSVSGVQYVSGLLRDGHERDRNELSSVCARDDLFPAPRMSGYWSGRHRATAHSLGQRLRDNETPARISNPTSGQRLARSSQLWADEGAGSIIGSRSCTICLLPSASMISRLVRAIPPSSMYTSRGERMR